MKTTKLLLGLLFMATLAFVAACGDDDKDVNSGPLNLTEITASGTNLDGTLVTKPLLATPAAVNVALTSVITITFSKDVDAATATSTNIMLTQGANAVPATVSADGADVTVTPTDDLAQDTDYTLTIGSGVKADDGGLFTQVTRTFTTESEFDAPIPQADKLVVYIPFNNDVTDEMDHTILNDEVTFGTDRFGVASKAATFNGTTNYVGVEYGTDMSNASTTVSYWIKLPASADYSAHIGTTGASNIKQYVTFAIGGNNGTFHEWNRFTCCDLGYDIDVLKYYTNHVNSGTASTLAGSNIEMKNEGNPGGDRVVEINNPNWIEDGTGVWMHIVTSWNAATRTKSFYINGVPSTVYTLTPSAEYALDAATIDVAGIDLDATNSRNLYLGSGVPYWATKIEGGITPFRSGIPFAFKGQMDDFRMFSVALTDAEVLALYNAEQP
jgi:Bacterial Ig-like domain